MRKSIKIFLFSGVLGLTTTSAIGQTGGPFVDFSPNFFIAIVAGIILAIAFQAILTFLSVAIGINVAGPFNQRNKANKDPEKAEKERGENKSDNTSTAMKISSAAGLWTLVTVSLSLFFASWFGVKLSLLQNNVIGMTLGLVIWAAFFLIMMYLEARAISSIAGGLYTIAANSFKTSAEAVKSMFTKSEETKLRETVDHSIDKIREEISARMDTDFITEKLDQYVAQLKPEPIDYARLEQELKHILNEIEIEHRMEPGEGKFDRRTFIRIAEENPRFTKEDVRKVGDMYDRAKKSMSGKEKSTEKLAAVFDTVTPGSDSDSAQIRNKIADYLKRTEAEEIQPEKLEHDLEEILSHPESSKDIIMNRVSQFDRNTLIQLVKASSDKIDDEKADRIVETAQSVLEKIKASVAGASSAFKSQEGEEGKFENIIGEKKQGAKSKQLELEMKLREFFDSFHRPEYDYDRIKADVIKLFKDPKLAPEMITLKLKDYDKDALVDILSRNKYLEKKDIENFIKKFEEAKDTIISKYEDVENQVREKLYETKQAALDKAEDARKMAAVASWWLVGTAVISGVASLLGGMLAL
jgi:hypothetical protein